VLRDRRGQRERSAIANRVQDDRVDHLRTRRESERGEHRALVVGARADVARDERVAALEVGERFARW
jgi:hypothetical protein